MKSLNPIALMLVILLLVGCGDRRGLVVAEVNGQQIYEKDFGERYTKYLAQFQQRDNIVLRKQILSNMMNEILIHENIRTIELDKDPRVVKRLEQIRLQAIIDDYAKTVSTDTMQISEQELWREFSAMNTRVNARYVYAESESEAERLKSRLEQGETFETIAREVFRDPGLANNGGSLGTFGWGEMEPELERVAFTMPIGTLSGPVKIRSGYAIVRVDHKSVNPLSSEFDYLKQKENLERAIRERKVIELVKKAGEQVAGSFVVSFDDHVVDEVFKHWDELTSQVNSTDVEKSQYGQNPNLWENEIARIGNESWSAGHFINRLGELTAGQTDRVKTSDDIKKLIHGLATRDAILQKATTHGVSQRALEQVARVREEYLLKQWAARVQDTVGQHGFSSDELRKHFEAKRHEYAFPPEVNVAEILLRSREEAEEILRNLRSGYQFSDLAREKSIRLWAAKKGGELGYGTRSSFGILGEKFFAADEGMILGPEFVDPYYGVFRILDKKEGRLKSFEESKESIEEEIRFVKRREVFAAAVNDLRSEAKVTMHVEALANVDLRKPI